MKLLSYLVKIKVPLEIVSVLIAIVLGFMAVWPQIMPSKDLVAEVVVTKARLPGRFLQDAKALPEEVEKALHKNKDFAKMIPDSSRRDEVLGIVKDVVERQSFSLHAFESLQDSFLAVTVRNEGERPLQDVKLGFRYPLDKSVTVIGADGVVRVYEGSGIIPLGDLPPHGEIQVYAWGLAFLVSSQTDVTVSHSGGIGKIFLLRSVPGFIRGNEGVFFPYEQMTYLLLAIMLVGGGGFSLSRYRTRRLKS